MLHDTRIESVARLSFHALICHFHRVWCVMCGTASQHNFMIKLATCREVALISDCWFLIAHSWGDNLSRTIWHTIYDVPPHVGCSGGPSTLKCLACPWQSNIKCTDKFILMSLYPKLWLFLTLMNTWAYFIEDHESGFYNLLSSHPHRFYSYLYTSEESNKHWSMFPFWIHQLKIFLLPAIY